MTLCFNITKEIKLQGKIFSSITCYISTNYVTKQVLVFTFGY